MKPEKVKRNSGFRKPFYYGKNAKSTSKKAKASDFDEGDFDKWLNQVMDRVEGVKLKEETLRGDGKPDA